MEIAGGVSAVYMEQGDHREWNETSFSCGSRVDETKATIDVLDGSVVSQSWDASQVRYKFPNVPIELPEGQSSYQVSNSDDVQPPARNDAVSQSQIFTIVPLKDEGNNNHQGQLGNRGSQAQTATTPTTLLERIRAAKVSLPLRSFIIFILQIIFKKAEESIIGDVVLTLVNIPMLAIGLSFMNDCRAETFIPVYLIEGGFFGIMSNIMSLFIKFMKRKTGKKYANSLLLVRVIRCFLIFWFIVGCFWTYNIFPPEKWDKSNVYYCSPVVYCFTFWLVTLLFIPLILLLVAVCSGIVYYFLDDGSISLVS